MEIFKRVGLCVVVVLCCCGCVSHSETGTPIDHDKVSKIQKGVTTRAEVVALLGPPLSVAMMGEGRRMLMYHASEMTGHVTPRLIGIPGFGNLSPSETDTSTRQQTLQIILSKADIVEDYEFSDTTNNVTEKSSTFGGASVQSSTVQNEPSK